MDSIFQLLSRYIPLLRIRNDVIKSHPWEIYEEFKVASVVIKIEIQQ